MWSFCPELFFLHFSPPFYWCSKFENQHLAFRGTKWLLTLCFEWGMDCLWRGGGTFIGTPKKKRKEERVKGKYTQNFKKITVLIISVKILCSDDCKSLRKVLSLAKVFFFLLRAWCIETLVKFGGKWWSIMHHRACFCAYNVGAGGVLLVLHPI